MVRVLVVPRFHGEDFLWQCTAVGILQRHLLRPLKVQPVRDLPTLVRTAHRRAQSETVVGLLPLVHDVSPASVIHVTQTLNALAPQAPKILTVVVIGGYGPVPRGLLSRLRRAGAADVVIDEHAPDRLAQRLQLLLLGDTVGRFVSACPPGTGPAQHLLVGTLLEAIVSGREASCRALASGCSCSEEEVRAELSCIGGFEYVRTRALLHFVFAERPGRARVEAAKRALGSCSALRRLWSAVAGHPLPGAEGDAQRVSMADAQARLKFQASATTQTPRAEEGRDVEIGHALEAEQEASQAFRRFRAVTWGPAVRTAARILGSHPAAEHLALRLVCDWFMRGREPPSSGEELATILAAVRNAALDEVRRVDARHFSLDSAMDRRFSLAPPPDLKAEGKDLRHRVEYALSDLDDLRAATTFYLVDMKGLLPAEAASIFGVRADRIGQLRRRARRRLSSILEADCPG